jgi:hypothetical protein
MCLNAIGPSDFILLVTIKVSQRTHHTHDLKLAAVVLALRTW